METISPMPELVPGLRPLDVGIVHCMLLRDVLKQNRWPGLVRAKMKKDFPDQGWKEANIGVVEIWKSPKPWDPSMGDGVPKRRLELERVNTQNDSRIAVSTTPRPSKIKHSLVEQRIWLSLYIEMVLWGLKWPSDQLISHDLEAMTYHFRSPMTSTLRLDLRITPGAVAPEETRIKWIELLNGMMYILRDIVAAEDWRTFTDKWSSYDYVIFCYVSMVDISGSASVV